MLATVRSSTLSGVEARPVRVEVDISNGLPGFIIVGLPDASVSESSSRVRSALRNSGFPAPSRKVTVNLAPGDLPKQGPRFDLAIALGVLAAMEELPAASLDGVTVLGELALDGAVQPVTGMVAAALEASRAGSTRLLLPASCAGEATRVDGLTLLPAPSLREAVELLQGKPPGPLPPAPEATITDWVDLAEVKGQLKARRALELSAAGGHHLMMVGPPGCGKTMLARCLPSILPPLAPQEELEVAAIETACSPSGTRTSAGRPFRAPDHSITRAALLGSSMPGEVTRAHLGVLFLDEFAELRRDCLEGLRQVMEVGQVEVARARLRRTYPATTTVVAAMNPCPCGYSGDLQRGCTCPPSAVRRYQGRFSGPLRDRFDLHVYLTRPRVQEMMDLGPAEPSSRVRRRVVAAHRIQAQRGCLNARLQGSRLRGACRLDRASRDFLARILESLGLSLRAAERILRTARTIADLAASEPVELEHLAEAADYRMSDAETS